MAQPIPLPVPDLSLPSALDEGDRATHAALVAQFVAAQAGQQLWMQYIGAKYQLRPGDQVAQDGTIARAYLPAIVVPQH